MANLCFKTLPLIIVNVFCTRVERRKLVGPGKSMLRKENCSKQASYFLRYQK